MDKAVYQAVFESIEKELHGLLFKSRQDAPVRFLHKEKERRVALLWRINAMKSWHYDILTYL